MRTAVALALAVALGACAGNRMEAPDCPEGPAENATGTPVAQDDGYNTYLTFPERQRSVAISAIREDGKEYAVNTTRDPDTGRVTVHGVYPTIVLRDGSRVACLVNPQFDPVGRRPKQ